MQFSNPGLLWLLFLALIPVIIHLFKFRRFKKVLFTRVDLLKLVLIKTGFGNKLKKLVVMTLRMLTIIALIFAFAKPFISTNDSQLNANKNHCIIFIDNSPTLFADGVEGPLFESAKKSARSIVRDLPENYTFHLLSNHQSSQPELLQKEEVLQEIDKLAIVNQKLALNEVQTAFKNVANEQTIGVYISDFRKGFISTDNNKIDSMGSQYWIKLPAIHNANIGIDSAWFDNPQILPNQMLTLNVKVSNFGTEQLEDIPLRLLNNNQLIASTSSSIDKSASTIFTLQFNSGEEGWKNLVLSLPGDELGFDDDFYISFLVQKGSKVIALQPEINANYLKSLFTNDAGFDFVSFKPTDLPYDQLATVDMVVLDGVVDLGSGLLSELKKFVDNGGSLMVFPSENAPFLNPEFLNTFGLNVSVKLKNQVIQANIWDNQQPLLKGIFEKIPKNPELPLIQRYVDLSSLSKKEVLWKLKNNDPLFVQLKKGNGNIFISSVGLQKDFGNLPLNPLFVPFMLRIASFKTADQHLFNYTFQNQLQKISGVHLPIGQVYSFKHELEEWIPEHVVRNNQHFLNHHRFVTYPGFYKLTSNQETTIANFAFNLPVSLSVTALEEESKLKAIASDYGATIVQDKPEFVANRITQAGKGTPLWHYFVLATGMFLILEMFVLKFWK